MGKVLLAGTFWGEDMVLQSDMLKDHVPAVTLTYTEVSSFVCLL